MKGGKIVVYNIISKNAVFIGYCYEGDDESYFEKELLQAHDQVRHVHTFIVMAGVFELYNFLTAYYHDMSMFQPGYLISDPVGGAKEVAALIGRILDATQNYTDEEEIKTDEN